MTLNLIEKRRKADKMGQLEGEYMPSYPQTPDQAVKSIQTESTSQSIIDVEALVLFKDHTEDEIRSYLTIEKKNDLENAECEEDKLTDKQIKIMERALAFHRTYKSAKYEIQRRTGKSDMDNSLTMTVQQRAALSLATNGTYGKVQDPGMNKYPDPRAACYPVLDDSSSLNPKTDSI